MKNNTLLNGKKSQSEFIFLLLIIISFFGVTDLAIETGFIKGLETIYTHFWIIICLLICLFIQTIHFTSLYKKNYPFMPIGFKLFELLSKYFIPIDIISVVRHNKTLSKGNYHISASKNNYYLRGFNYLFVMYKVGNKTLDNNGMLHLRDL